MLRGTTTRRKNEERYTLGLPIISFTGNLAIEEPIIIRAAGTVILPTIVTGRNDIPAYEPQSYQEGGNEGTQKSRKTAPRD